MAASSVMTFSL